MEQPVSKPSTQFEDHSNEANEKGAYTEGAFSNTIARPSLSDNEDSNIREGLVLYPEGGLAAWLVVFGAFCGLCAGVGIMNTVGAFQLYLSTNQLRQYSSGEISWIFGVYSFLTYACGIIVGPLFDLYDARWLIATGGSGVVATMFLTAVCQKYWHFMLVLGVLNGMASSCLFCPCFAVIGHWFNVRRGFATGIAALGGCIGGIVYPIVLQNLIPKIGWANTLRVLGAILFLLCSTACVFIRKRLPALEDARLNLDFTIFKNSTYAVTVAALFMVECAVLVPLTYISSYAVHESLGEALASQLLMAINASSIMGRIVPGLLSDKIGRFNMLILVTTTMVISVLGIWLPVGHTKPGVICFAILFGIGSGSSINLVPVCLGQLCRTEEYGRYYATANTVFSVGLLLGLPISGELIKLAHGAYWGLIVFVASCYLVGMVLLVVARCMKVGTRLTNAF
ncbi:riboflavin transporter MCH5 [Halenospora varia]|nr:riboflavin transporter MCH5 [Halenospora varia]